jgi:hypothetical protein
MRRDGSVTPNSFLTLDNATIPGLTVYRGYKYLGMLFRVRTCKPHMMEDLL